MIARKVRSLTKKSHDCTKMSFFDKTKKVMIARTVNSLTKTNVMIAREVNSLTNDPQKEVMIARKVHSLTNNTKS